MDSSRSSTPRKKGDFVQKTKSSRSATFPRLENKRGKKLPARDSRMHRGSSRYRGGEGDLLESGIGPRESATQAFRRFPPTRNNSRWLASGCRLTSSRPHRRVWIRTRCKPRFAFGNNVPETLCPIRLCFHVSKNATSLRPSLVFAKRSNLSPQCLLARPARSLYY